MTSDYLVEQVPTSDVLVLRMSVLRDGTPSQDPRYAEDDTEGSVHLGIQNGGVLIACSTWLPRPWPLDESAPATQLRGMAVAKHLQSKGLGRILLKAGIRRAHSLESTYVWARARDNALYFYERNGFATVGDQFIDEATGLGHHLVMIEV
ncbi:MAG: GNAT family N-acetyltransferase [Actinobacteria bacterium]|nr:MAG: GNAT family N-acetyltransferase [Actinomycetota bacterium]